ncbi:DUF1344 domain-containing protein [[Phormidium] sp. ETS-05]|uniref:DUF1344 domain-containing protein n=1 Tax=[Phormidium] sp. ETS-05 TaxID=222819 RepID=UPI0018EECC62|nr:DUF1344 domain-containing protein [[Phormidium] sp. ETS-05]
MSINLTGTIKRIDIGTGAWALAATDGKTYEIARGAPKEMLKAGQQVKVIGNVRDDVMTFAAIGPVLEVQTFEPLG